MVPRILDRRYSVHSVGTLPWPFMYHHLYFNIVPISSKCCVYITWGQFVVLKSNRLAAEVHLGSAHFHFIARRRFSDKALLYRTNRSKVQNNTWQGRYQTSEAEFFFSHFWKFWEPHHYLYLVNSKLRNKSKKEIVTVDQNVKGETQYMTKSFYSFISTSLCYISLFLGCWNIA